MSISLPSSILNLRGQVVKEINFDAEKHSLTIRCCRDQRIKNVGIGLIRKRARGIRDIEYFKLKIRQLGTPETAPFQ